MFWSSSISSLVALSSQFSIMSLQVLESLFLNLCFFNRLLTQSDSVGSEDCVGGCSLRQVLVHPDRSEVLVLVANVPVPDSVDIEVAHIISFDIAHFLTSNLDLPCEVVLSKPP